jgi:hypothetical protein
MSIIAGSLLVAGRVIADGLAADILKQRIIYK